MDWISVVIGSLVLVAGGLWYGICAERHGATLGERILETGQSSAGSAQQSLQPTPMSKTDRGNSVNTPAMLRKGGRGSA